MHRNRLVTGLAAAFGLMTLVLAVGGLVTTPVLLVLAALFGAITYLLYEHASGRLMGRIYRGVERQAAVDGVDPERGGFGAGPREEWTPPRQEQRRRARQQARQRTRRRREATGGAQQGPSPREAYDVLGVEPGADHSTVKRAYRERIKQVHPDADGGDEAEFKRVQAAYERLTE